MFILRLLAGFFATSAGTTAGNAISNVATIAALTPLVMYIGRELIPELATLIPAQICFTPEQIVVVGGLLALVIKAAHWTQPAPTYSSPYR